MTLFNVYAKFIDSNNFYPLDLSTGSIVKKLIYATLIEENNLSKTIEYLNLVKADQPEILLQIRQCSDKKIIYSI